MRIPLWVFAMLPKDLTNVIGPTNWRNFRIPIIPIIQNLPTNFKAKSFNSKSTFSGNKSKSTNSRSSNNRFSDSRPSTSKPKPAYASKLGSDGKITQAEKDRRCEEGLCLYCGGKGHNVENCKKRPAEWSPLAFERLSGDSCCDNLSTIA